MSNLKKIGLTLIALSIVFGWWWLTRLPIPASEQNKPTNVILPSDWYVGTLDAQIKVVEYSDFQCPACRFYRQVDTLLLSRFPGRVGIAYRHFPLREIHPSANLAAQTAEVAGKQGKFWEMSAILFDRQDEWSQSNQPLSLFAEYATELGMDKNRFVKDIDSRDVRALVEADYLSGLVARVNSTPSFYVNGQKINNLNGPEDLIARIELMLNEATGSSQVQ
jgi:protein-disulfide isomerase